MEAIVYDKIGSTYNTTRRADPYITGKIYELLEPKPEGLYLDIGCGTGNYLTALAQKGLRFIGVDPSETMLDKARAKDNNARFICAKAEQIPLPDESMDGATAIFTIHHWNDIGQGLKEVGRVLKPGAPLVFLSYTSEQLAGYWLHHYFPRMIADSMLTPDMDYMERLLDDAGFGAVRTEKYFVKEDLQDHFLYSNKHRPEQYLKEEVRNGASSFTVFADPEEVKQGLKVLEADIASGKIREVMQQYENDLGDYLFIQAVKQ